jgi:hypothetical protein
MKPFPHGTASLPSWILRPPRDATHYQELIGALLENGLIQVEGNMLTCTTDSAAVMIAAIEAAEYVHTRCIAHSLHNGSKEDTFGADNDPVLSAPVKLAGFFSSISTHRNMVASEMAEQMGLPLQKPVLPVATRWSSYHAAYKRHNDRWPVISQLNNKLLKLKDKEAGLPGGL